MEWLQVLKKVKVVLGETWGGGKMKGKVIKVTETPKARVVEVRVQDPWPGNIYEDYEFASNSLNIGDEVEVEWKYAAVPDATGHP